MRKLITTVVLLAFALPSSGAATPTEFYLGLLRRGTTDVMAGEYRRGASVLRLAAFGLVESIEHYQLAEIHLAIASDRLGDLQSTRDAARRVLAAELIERRYASLSLPPAVRTEFETLAKKVLSPGETEMMFAAPPRPAPVGPGTAIQAPVTPSGPAAAAGPASATATAPPPTARSGGKEEATTNTAAKSVSTAPPATGATSSLPQIHTAGRADVKTQLAQARTALESGRLEEARGIYRSVLSDPSIPRATVIAAAEGLYRARDFKGSLDAFERAGTLQAGEEPYHYYLAVALYETGQYARAKSELAAALPHIQVSPAISSYVAKIEAAKP